jgi:glycosyltransferase involved in cell wall biosynthesis
VIVVDGHSGDDTLAVARRLRPDARIVMQTRTGKGNALACGFAAATGDVIAMIDADGSNDPAEIPRCVAALLSGADFAKGTRFAPSGGAASNNPIERRRKPCGPLLRQTGPHMSSSGNDVRVIVWLSQGFEPASTCFGVVVDEGCYRLVRRPEANVAGAGQPWSVVALKDRGSRQLPASSGRQRRIVIDDQKHFRWRRYLPQRRSASTVALRRRRRPRSHAMRPPSRTAPPNRVAPKLGSR